MHSMVHSSTLEYYIQFAKHSKLKYYIADIEVVVGTPLRCGVTTLFVLCKKNIVLYISKQQ
jgi:hypothetical protein